MRTTKQPQTPASPQPSGPKHGDPETTHLSQLSDLVALESQAGEQEPPSYPALLESQELHVGTDYAEEVQLPSQPDIPPPNLLGGTSFASGSGGRRSPEEHSRPVHSELLHNPIVLPSDSLSGDAAMQLTGDGVDSVRPVRSKASRRGPMDEMRQLVRILVKIIPHSVGFITSSEEGGGGNRISEEQIKMYLDSTLGEAPRPAWGVPNGWGDYLAGMLSWALNKHISKEQAMRCAKREPGRSWEAIEAELSKLVIHGTSTSAVTHHWPGAYPASWPLPLTREGLARVPASAAKQPVPLAGAKRHIQDPNCRSHAKRRIVGVAATVPGAEDLECLSEVELWQRICSLLMAAKRKSGSTSSPALEALKGDARLLFDDLAMALPAGQTFGGLALGAGLADGGAQPGGTQMLSVVPVLVQGANGQIVTGYQLPPASFAAQAQAFAFPAGSSGYASAPGEFQGQADAKAELVYALQQSPQQPVRHNPHAQQALSAFFSPMPSSSPPPLPGLSPGNGGVTKPQAIRAAALPMAARNAVGPTSIEATLDSLRAQQRHSLDHTRESPAAVGPAPEASAPQQQQQQQAVQVFKPLPLKVGGAMGVVPQVMGRALAAMGSATKPERASLDGRGQEPAGPGDGGGAGPQDPGEHPMLAKRALFLSAAAPSNDEHKQQQGAAAAGGPQPVAPSAFGGAVMIDAAALQAVMLRGQPSGFVAMPASAFQGALQVGQLSQLGSGVLVSGTQAGPEAQSAASQRQQPEQPQPQPAGRQASLSEDKWNGGGPQHPGGQQAGAPSGPAVKQGANSDQERRPSGVPSPKVSLQQPEWHPVSAAIQ